GKGLHFGVKRMKMFLRRFPEYKWFVKTDYKKFYESIPHDVIINALRRKYKDERFIKLVKIAILSYNSDIEKALEDEKGKRCGNRLLYEPAIG
ncbi:MAG: reverse transcriptase, partial [Bacteroidaceae bacterium]